MRTKPGLFAGSLFALAFTAGIIGYTASHFGKSDEIVFEANHIDQFNDTSNQAPIGHDFDNRIEVSDAEELRTSIKPLNIPAPEEPSGSSLSSTVSKSERLNVTAIPIDAPRGEGSAPPPDTGTKASINVFEERFGSSDLDITSPEQVSLC